MKSGRRLSTCSAATKSQNISRSFSSSFRRVLLGAPSESGKSDFSGAPVVEPAGAAPRRNISPFKSAFADSRGWGWWLADEGADDTLQYRPFALGALGNHDQARIGDEKSLPVALEVVSYLLALGNIDVLVDNRAPDFRVPPDIHVVQYDRVLDQAVRMHDHRASQHRV